MRAFSINALQGVSVLALMASLAPVSTMAQTQAAPAAADSSANSLTEIIVTARRRDESIQDVPSVVNAVTAETVSKLNIRNFAEVQSLVPGLSLTSAANGTGGNAQIRGVNFDINASGNNPTVEFYLNDAPITAGVILQQMFDVGQVEVLRGPQGTLRGRASPSGSITITTKKPDLYRFGASAGATVNDIGTANATGAVTIPVVEGKVAIRIAGLYDENDANRVTSISNPDVKPDSKTKSGRITGLATPIDWLRLEGSYQYIDQKSVSFEQTESFSEVNPTAPASPVLIRASDRQSDQTTPRRVHQTYDIYNWRAEVSVVGQQLIYQGQHYTQTIRSSVTQDAAVVFPTSTILQNTASDISSTSQEVRLQNQERVFDLFDYSLGYFDNKNDTPTKTNSVTLIRAPLASGGGLAQIINTPIGRGGNSREKAFFGNVTAHIGDSTAISGGLRHIDYHDEGILLVSGALTSKDVHDYKKWIYTASIQHYLNRDLMLYANAGTSFRPGISAVGDFSLAQSALEKSFLNLPPETSKSYEAGFKSTLLENRMRFNLSVYQQKFQNYPYRAPNSIYYVTTGAGGQSVGTFNFVAAVPVKVYGVEGELAYDVNSQWNLNLVAAYAHGRIQNGTVPCNDLNGDGKPDSVTTAPSVAQLQAVVGANNLSACTLSQNSSNQAPFSATAQSEYHMPVSDTLEGYARGLVSYYSKSDGDPTNAFDDVKAYGLLNLFVGVREQDGRWDLGLYAKNVFDTNKVLTRSLPLSTSYRQMPTFAGTTTTSTYTSITTSQPREVGVTLRVALGVR